MTDHFYLNNLKLTQSTLHLLTVYTRISLCKGRNLYLLISRNLTLQKCKPVHQTQLK